jgi:hypothetical protein
MTSAEYEAWREQRLWRPSTVLGMKTGFAAEAAEFLAPTLADSGRVSGWIPRGFEAYARVLFPFVGDYIYEGEECVGCEFVKWAEMASLLGHQIHQVIEAAHGSELEATPYGALPDDSAQALLAVLGRHTSSTSAWFLLWNGRGDLDAASVPAAAVLRRQDHDYMTLRGTLQHWPELPYDPNWCWPDDRAWCYQDNIDSTDVNYAHVGGSESCIAELLRSEHLEVVRVGPDDQG